ncbi:MAG TPA: hypothetical protein VM661_11250 [Candidatus Sulfotelmatobacter sp.]|jgi:hypothetical protein|nr:hypothetical protein [Candidatus Sulfotelmatobacter sp.]
MKRILMIFAVAGLSWLAANAAMAQQSPDMPPAAPQAGTGTEHMDHGKVNGATPRKPHPTPAPRPYQPPPPRHHKHAKAPPPPAMPGEPAPR